MAAVADSHRQLHGVLPDLAGIHIGLRRHDIVERRQPEPPCPHPLRQTAADLFVVRQQVVEDGNDGIANKPVLAQRQ